MKNIAAVDLNLLLAFNALFIERNVTRAGDRIGLAQPSMSNALSRLRTVFDDELFLRTPGGMVPTPTALKAAEHVSAALRAAEHAVNVGRVFDPRTSVAHITLLANDYVERVMLPTLVGTLSSQAPSVRVSVRPVPDEGYQHALADGTADLAIAAAPDPTGRFHYTTLIQDKPVCIARRGHPVVSTRLTLKRFLACQHAHVSSRKRLHGPIDVALAERGQARDVVATASSYNALPDLVAETDLIAVVPERLARAVCRRLPLDSHALPFAVPAFELKLIWGRATDSAALHRWFREQVCNAAGGLSG